MKYKKTKSKPPKGKSVPPKGWFWHECDLTGELRLEPVWQTFGTKGPNGGILFFYAKCSFRRVKDIEAPAVQKVRGWNQPLFL